MYPKQSTLYLTHPQIYLIFQKIHLTNIFVSFYLLIFNNTIIKRTGTPSDSEQMKFLAQRLQNVDEKLT